MVGLHPHRIGLEEQPDVIVEIPHVGSHGDEPDPLEITGGREFGKIRFSEFVVLREQIVDLIPAAEFEIERRREKVGVVEAGGEITQQHRLITRVGVIAAAAERKSLFIIKFPAFLQYMRPR